MAGQSLLMRAGPELGPVEDDVDEYAGHGEAAQSGHCQGQVLFYLFPFLRISLACHTLSCAVQGTAIAAFPP